MIFKHWAFALLHLAHVLGTWKIISVYFMPRFISNACLSALEYSLCVIVTCLTFRFVKRKWVAGQVNPENKAVLITGCDTGFGHMLSQRLDSAGFMVLAGCLFPNGPGAQELKNKCSENLKVVALDVTKEESIANSVEVVMEHLGQVRDLWAVVNNAGVLKGFTADMSSIHDFVDCLSVNVLGTIRITKAFLPLLKDCQPKGARIINVTSIGGRIPVPYMTPYITSKFATTGFTECLRQELRVWDIQVIAIEPELFGTQMGNLKGANHRMDEVFSKLDVNLKNDYGDKYCRFLRESAGKYVNLASSNIDRVADALVSAVSSQYPDHTYQPSRNFFVECCRNLIDLTPITLRDYFFQMCNVCFKLPKPQRMQGRQMGS